MDDDERADKLCGCPPIHAQDQSSCHSAAFRFAEAANDTSPVSYGLWSEHEFGRTGASEASGEVGIQLGPSQSAGGRAEVGGFSLNLGTSVRELRCLLSFARAK